MKVNEKQREYLSKVFLNIACIVFGGYVIGISLSETFSLSKWYYIIAGFVITLSLVFSGMYILTEKEK